MGNKENMITQTEEVMDKELDLRIKKTYHSLHTAFTELLEKKRFEDFTVNELCEQAMIRRTTFYKHFSDKYDYFTFYMKEICEQFRAQLPPDTFTGNINVYFSQMSRELLHFMKKNENLVRNIAESDMFPVLLSLLSNHITEDVLLTAQKLTPDMDLAKLEGISAFYSGGLLNLLLYYMKHNKILDDSILTRIISEFTLD